MRRRSQEETRVSDYQSPPSNSRIGLGRGRVFRRQAHEPQHGGRRPRFGTRPIAVAGQRFPTKHVPRTWLAAAAEVRAVTRLHSVKGAIGPARWADEIRVHQAFARSQRLIEEALPGGMSISLAFELGASTYFLSSARKISTPASFFSFATKSGSCFWTSSRNNVSLIFASTLEYSIFCAGIFSMSLIT